MVVSAIHNDERPEAVSVEAVNRFYLMCLCHKLQWGHIRNRLIAVRKRCTFQGCIDCGKYYRLICQDWKLLVWPSYVQTVIILLCSDPAL